MGDDRPWTAGPDLRAVFQNRTAGLRRRAGDHSTAGTTGGAAGLAERRAVS